MKRGMLILAAAVCISLFFLTGASLADQDPNDSYGPDSVLFRSRELLVPCPPGAGQAVVPLYFRNDTPVIGVQAPLKWTGPAELDSVGFFGSRISYLYDKEVTIDNPNRKVLVTASVGTQLPIPEGRGMLVKFFFSTSDTGLLLIDTVANSPQPEEHLQFTREDAVTYTPQFQQGQFHLTCGQDPNDPNVADTVFFCSQYAYYPLPGGPGLFYAHVCVTCDDSVGAITLPLAWSGPAEFDSITFAEVVFPESIRVISPEVDSITDRAMVGLIPFHDPPIPPTQGLFTTMCFTLPHQTGIVPIE